MPSAFQEVVMVDALAIRDVTDHDPSTDDEIVAVDVHSYQYVVLYCNNGLDQTVRVQFFGNIGRVSTTIQAASIIRPSRVGAPVNIMTLDSEIRTAGQADLSLVPILYARCTALVQPTSGSLTITAVCFGTIQGL